MSDPRPFHRIFGLAWFDFFQGAPVTVSPEIDLSFKQQLLDLAFTRTASEPVPRPLPDGFDDLAEHNLVTFKSYQETLEVWTLLEHVGHYVNYRKQYSQSMQDLLPVTAFRLFAVCVRFPQNLAGEIELTRIREGVYEVRALTLRIRIIVIHELPLEQQNAMLHLFSAQEEQIRCGQDHYRPHSTETSSLLYDLLKAYSEDPEMANILQEYLRERLPQLLQELSPEERLKGLPPEKRLEGLSPEERLEGLSQEEMRAAMEVLQRKLKTNGTSPNPP